jgi:hypothetical protein
MVSDSNNADTIAFGGEMEKHFVHRELQLTDPL